MTATSPTAPRIEGVVVWLDRILPLVWVGFYVLLPVSGWWHVMFDSWADQMRDLAALRSLLETGHADAIASNAVGPAYIGTAAVLHLVLRVDAETALVLLTRTSYALSVAVAMLLTGALVRRLCDAGPIVSLAAQFLVAGAVFAAGTWHWSDVPWSHFYAMFLAVSVYALRFAPARLGAHHAAILGVALALLSLTRSYEFVAIALAWAMAAILFLFLRSPGGSRPAVQPLLAVTGTFVVTLVAVYAGTGKRDAFLLYGNRLDEQPTTVAGHATAVSVEGLPTFTPSYIPTKLVQLFLEPCYEALCSVADYAGGASPLPPQLAGAAGSELLWRLPIAVQLPMLVLLPACLLALLLWLALALALRRDIGKPAREEQALFEMAIASAGIVVGYAASTMTGSPHLRYGFARDLLLPALLVTIVAVTLGCVGLWAILSRGVLRIGVSGGTIVACVAVVVTALVVGSAAYTRANGIPRLRAKRVDSVLYTASCRDHMCRVELVARRSGHGEVSIPRSSMLAFGCGSSEVRFKLYIADPATGFQLDRTCDEPRLVAAWPTVMGLPPGEYELGFVKVANS